MEHTPKFSSEPSFEDDIIYLPITRENGQEQLSYWQGQFDYWRPLVPYHEKKLSEAVEEVNTAAKMVGVLAVALWGPADEEIDE